MFVMETQLLTGCLLCLTHPPLHGFINFVFLSLFALSDEQNPLRHRHLLSGVFDANRRVGSVLSCCAALTVP